MYPPGQHTGKVLSGKSKVLLHLVDSLSKTGNFSGRVILVIDALRAGSVDLGSSIPQGFRGGSLVTRVNRGVDLLNGSLDSGADRLIAGSSLLIRQNPLLRGFNVCQSVHLRTTLIT